MNDTPLNSNAPGDSILPTYCANHPQVETSLRCSRCGKLICMRCAVRTPTGYRCKDCVRGQQKVFETAAEYDPLVAFVVAAPLSFLGGLFIPNFVLFALLLSPLAGGLIAEAVRLAVRRRRSPRLFLFAAAGALVGALLPAGYAIFTSLSWLFFAQSPQASLPGAGLSIGGLVWPLIGHVLYTILVTTTTYYRLSGIHLRY